MQIDLQRLLNYLLLALSVVGGITAGMLAARTIDLSLGSETALPIGTTARSVTERQLQVSDFQIILQRNLFDSSAEPIGRIDLSSKAITATTVDNKAKPIGDLVLIGTVVAGQESLALIKAGGKTKVYRLQDSLAPQIVISEIGRKMIVLIDHGSRRELLLKESKGARKRAIKSSGRTSSKAGSKRGVVAVDENNWKISKAVVSNARANLNSLLQTARMVPQLNNGQTVGFKVVELKKGSLLEQIGLQVGDLVVKINQVELNSPEKALQIFQQVREANNLSLGLVRSGQPKTFEYSFE